MAMDDEISSHADRRFNANQDPTLRPRDGPFAMKQTIFHLFLNNNFTKKTWCYAPVVPVFGKDTGRSLI